VIERQLRHGMSLSMARSNWRLWRANVASP
jgi:hypothetical protein